MWVIFSSIQWLWISNTIVKLMKSLNAVFTRHFKYINWVSDRLGWVVNGRRSMRGCVRKGPSLTANRSSKQAGCSHNVTPALSKTWDIAVLWAFGFCPEESLVLPQMRWNLKWKQIVTMVRKIQDYQLSRRGTLNNAEVHSLYNSSLVRPNLKKYPSN
jgi:hypothetical protein